MTTAKKLELIASQQSVIAQKVLSAVPSAEQWSISAIFGELKRLGHNIDPNTMKGCLNSLKEQGLIREPKRGEFILVSERGELKATLARKQATDKNIAPPQKKEEPPIEKLTRLTQEAATVAHQAKLLADEIKRISLELEDAALELDDAMSQQEKDLANFRHLQEVLKIINTK